MNVAATTTSTVHAAESKDRTPLCKTRVADDLWQTNREVTCKRCLKRLADEAEAEAAHQRRVEASLAPATEGHGYGWHHEDHAAAEAAQDEPVKLAREAAEREAAVVNLAAVLADLRSEAARPSDETLTEAKKVVDEVLGTPKTETAGREAEKAEAYRQRLAEWKAARDDESGREAEGTPAEGRWSVKNPSLTVQGRNGREAKQDREDAHATAQGLEDALDILRDAMAAATDSDAPSVANWAPTFVNQAAGTLTEFLWGNRYERVLVEGRWVSGEEVTDDLVALRGLTADWVTRYRSSVATYGDIRNAERVAREEADRLRDELAEAETARDAYYASEQKLATENARLRDEATTWKHLYRGLANGDRCLRAELAEARRILTAEHGEETVSGWLDLLRCDDCGGEGGSGLMDPDAYIDCQRCNGTGIDTSKNRS